MCQIIDEHIPSKGLVLFLPFVVEYMKCGQVASIAQMVLVGFYVTILDQFVVLHRSFVILDNCNSNL